jgi:putative addiction module component (TIGR02574 family)
MDGLAAGPCYLSPVTPADVKGMSIEQKLQIMEVIWNDLREQFDQKEISAEQKALLDRRRTRVQHGAAQLRDWDSVKMSIGKA